MSQELYYTPPEDIYFEEMKKTAIEIWDSYDDTFWYATEKKNRIKDVQNIWDNFLYIFAMFDIHNQNKCLQKLSEECKKQVYDRLS